MRRIVNELGSSYSIRQSSEELITGEISPVDLVDACIHKIKKFDPFLNAFITVIEDRARQDAAIAEKEIQQGLYRGVLHGIPFSIKDMIYSEGVRCTAGSSIMSDYVSHFDATAVAKMKKAGTILIGTNNLNEFACGVTGMNSDYGASKNPWNTSRISGGSGGGSAVAVSAGIVPLSLGTDTGGSIRIPSSLCGIYGLKPTYCRISRYGIMSFSTLLDHVGCITRSAWDAAGSAGIYFRLGCFRPHLSEKASAPLY